MSKEEVRIIVPQKNTQLRDEVSRQLQLLASECLQAGKRYAVSIAKSAVESLFDQVLDNFNR